jgi:ATP/maltotriose-dependent transcriptional regulator MalT
VVRLWDQVSDAEALCDLDLPSVYLHAVKAAEVSGQRIIGAHLAEEALERLAATASPPTAVSLYAMAGQFRSFDSLQAGSETLAVAVSIGDSIPPTRDYVHALHWMARVRADLGHVDDERPLLARALLAAEQADASGERKLLLAELAWLAMADGDVEQALATLDSAARVVVDPADTYADALVFAHHTDVLFNLGDLERAVDVGRAAIAWASQRGLSNMSSIDLIRATMANALTERGDVVAAAAIIDPLTEAAPPDDRWLLYVARADLDLRRGRLTDAAGFWNRHPELVSVASPHMSFYCAVPHLETELWLGKPTTLLPHVFSVLETYCASDAAPFAGDLFVLVARACADAAEQARARSARSGVDNALDTGARLGELLAGARRDPFAEGRVPATASADLASWRAESSRLRGGSNTGLWEQAATAWDALGRPHRAAYARWRHAEAALAEPGGRVAATSVLRTAAEQAVHHVPLSTAIHNVALRAGIDLAYPDSRDERRIPARTRAFGLTDRELAVLQLLGAGKTNPEIAATLFISAKTASVHVTHILRKLNVASRVQAATVAERAGLLGGDSAEVG